MAETKKLRLGLIGNPNVGKTTIFNAITGARQKTGNWPGVTVEKKTGQVTHKGVEIEVIDLPGTYGLTAYSPDEIIARDFILNEKPDVVLQIVDTTNLERNLYLTTQLAEITPNLMLALNLTDFAEAQGLAVDADRLSKELSIPVVKTVGTRKEGIDELLDAAIGLADAGSKGDGSSSYKGFVSFSPKTEEAITKISEVLSEDKTLTAKYPTRWLAVSLLEEDGNVLEKVKENADLYAKVSPILSSCSPEEAEADIADGRYTQISALAQKVRRGGTQAKISPSDTLDHVLTDKWLGIPIFLALMCAAFDLTFTFGAPFMTLIETVVGWLAAYVVEAIPGMLGSVLGDGIIAGVGSVLVFLPNILILFFVLSILEDTGYLARAAFIMDRPLHALGLPGKAFIPMLSGFGCNVPGLMAARTIEDDKDRLLTLLVTPFMSCGARLPIYVLFAGVFFTANAGEVIFSLYLLGIVIAIVSAFIFKRTLFKGDPAPFIMEMPPYRIPTLFAALEHMWSRGELYLRKAGT
ncbi:MAG: ferrous iron transport protein B, partial [Methanomicrobium sp.]|nr:ferrous iron transport protein B [Methanomicrobium sp.]